MNDTISPAVARGEADDDWKRRWRWRRSAMWAGIFVGLLVAVVVAGFVVSVPRVAFRPGGVQATAGLIEVDGAVTYESEGELFYTTVQIPRLSLWEWLWYENFDDDADVFDEEDIFGTESPDETRACNAQMMRTSKSTAALVSLAELGYDPLTPSGVAVQRVFDDTPAAGVLVCGDVVLTVDGEAVLTSLALRDAVVERRPGDVVSLEVEDVDGQVRTESVVLADNGSGGGLLGVSTGTRFDQNDLPVDVEIDTGKVGGPSAGLAFTLAIIDTLSEDDLTGGRVVAVTGTIAIDGSVGPVGGVRQKVIAARRSGAEVFLLPAQARCEPGPAECRRDLILAESGDMIIVEVSTLDEALTALGEIRSGVLT